VNINDPAQAAASATISTPTEPVLTADAAFQALCESLLVDAAASGRTMNVEAGAGLLFERVARAYLLLSSEYAHKDTRVARFTDWARSNPDWSGPVEDNGVDLVLQMHSRVKPFPVQVKFATGDEYTQSPLPRTWLDALTSETRVPGRIDIFDKPMILTNARSFTTRAHDRIAAEGIVAHGYDWFVSVNETMLENDVALPTTLAELLVIESQTVSSATGAIQAPQVPLPHQVEATAHVQKVLESSDRTTVHFACGTGKTLISWMLVDERVAVGETAVLFVPALSLARDAISTFMRQANGDVQYDILAVCSDVTVRYSNDAAVSNNSASNDMDINVSDLSTSDVTSDPAVIAAWLSKPSTMRRLLVATYQSSALVKEAVKTSEHTFNLLVGDEAHRLAGMGTFGKPIWDVNTLKSVFMTATPQVTGEIDRRTQEVKVAGMSDASKFCAEADWFTYTTSQGVDGDILSPYRINVYVTHEGDEDCTTIATAMNRSEDSLDGAAGNLNVNARMVVTAAQCAKTMRENRGGKGMGLVFFSSIRESKDFAAYVKAAYPDVPAAHVDGSMNTEQRMAIFRRITASGGVFSNVRVMNEGVNIPALSMVTFASPRNSKVDIVQGVGRVLRKDHQNPGKVGEIIIPIVLPADVADNDVDAMIENTAFASLWSTIRALADNDDTILRMLVVLKNPSLAGTSDGAGRTYPSVEDATSGFNGIFTVTVASRRLQDALAAGDGTLLGRFTDSISTRMLRSMGGDWMTTYAAVLAYMDEHGRNPSRADITPAVKRLGFWCNNQRTAKMRGSLSDDRVALLELISSWVWEQRQDIWDEAFEATKEYMSKHWRSPSQGDVNPDVQRLGGWCNNQRQAKKNGTLSVERTTLIESIPGWTWNLSRDAWDESFEATKTYMAEHGRMPSNGARDHAVKRLGSWCSGQRMAKNRNALSVERVALLESIPGWVWGQARQYGLMAWDESFEATKTYMAEHGSTPSQKDRDPIVKRLGQWCSKQRQEKRNETLSAESVALLDTIPGWGWGRDPDAAWNNAFEATKAYMNENNVAPSQGDVDRGVKQLGQWCSKQRQARADGSLSVERIALLDTIPGWVWDQRQDLWDESFGATKTYMIEHGISPRANDLNYIVKSLGVWCGRQHMAKNRNALSVERIALLDTIPGWVWDQYQDAWDEAFEATKAYMDRHGKEPRQRDDDPAVKSLGIWCQNKRKDKRRGVLSAERIALLESIPGWSWGKA